MHPGVHDPDTHYRLDCGPPSLSHGAGRGWDQGWEPERTSAGRAFARRVKPDGGAGAAVTADGRPRSPGPPGPPYILLSEPSAFCESAAMRTVGRMLLRRAMPARPSVSVTTVARLSSFTPARFLNVLAAHPTSRLASALQLPHAVRGFAASAAGARLSHSQPQPSGIPRAPGAEDRLISVPPAGPLARWPLARTHTHTHTHTVAML